MFFKEQWVLFFLWGLVGVFLGFLFGGFGSGGFFQLVFWGLVFLLLGFLWFVFSFCFVFLGCWDFFVGFCVCVLVGLFGFFSGFFFVCLGTAVKWDTICWFSRFSYTSVLEKLFAFQSFVFKVHMSSVIRSSRNSFFFFLISLGFTWGNDSRTQIL